MGPNPRRASKEAVTQGREAPVEFPPGPFLSHPRMARSSWCMLLADFLDRRLGEKR